MNKPAAPALGIEPEGRKAVSAALGQVLADTFALAFKTQAHHWNVTGPDFPQLHEVFGEQYEALFEAADEIAERIRALGHPAPGGLATMAKTASIADPKPGLDASAMVAELLAGQEAASRGCRAAMRLAQKHGDEVTADLMIERMDAHDKAAWMLRSILA
jgi:starvation-inducible DNA-binding protein